VRPLHVALAFAVGAPLAVACGQPAPHAAPDEPSPHADASASAPIDAAPATAPPVPLAVVAPRPLVGVPDAFSPTGELVGQRHGESCDVWDVGVGAFRGTFPKSTCDDWMAQAGRAAGRKLRVAGATLLVETEGSPSKVVGRLEGCWNRPAATAISEDGEHVAAICGAHVWVWPATGGKAEDLGDLDPDARSATLAFAGKSMVVALVEHADPGRDGCDGRTEFVDCDRFDFVKMKLGTKPERTSETMGIARLDPFGHLLFRAGGACGEGECFEDVRVQPLGLANVALEWTVTPRAKPAALTIAHRFSDEGNACLVRANTSTTMGPVPTTLAALVAKDGSDPVVLVGVRPVVAPNGRRAASIVVPSFTGALGSVEIVTLGGDGDPPRRRSIVLSDPAVTALVFSADAALLAVQFAKRVTVYDAESGRPVLFWDGVQSVAFDHARPGFVFAQKGDAVVRRALAPGGTDAPLSIAGKMLRGSFARRHPMFLSQNGMTVAIDGGGTESGRWPVTADEVLFGEGGVAALVGPDRVSVVELGRSGAVAWSTELAKGRKVQLVGRELWLDGSRRDAVTGTVLGTIALERGTEPSPDGTWSCGDSVVRRDGARLDVVDGAAVSESGAYQGVARGADAFALRAEGDPLTAPMLRAGTLPPRAGLVHDFFVGAAIAAPVSTGPLPALKVALFRNDPGKDGNTTQLLVAGTGKLRIYGSRGDLLTTLDPAPPTEVRALSFPGFVGASVEACEGDLCTGRTAARLDELGVGGFRR
jgi:hypothetical protein